MKTIVQIISMAAFVLVITFPFGGYSKAQEKPKDIAVKPATIDVPFSPGDAVEFNRYWAIMQDANSHLTEILNNYGGLGGDMITDKKGIIIGVRKLDSKVEPKKP